MKRIGSERTYPVVNDLNPLNRSQKPIVISKIAMGISNHERPTIFSKLGEMRKAKAQITHHADEITPKAANERGIYLDLNHK
jgi:hypothetical protein